MILLASSAELRLDMIRDLKGGGYLASAPKEDEPEAGYTVHVEGVPAEEQARVLDIARGADPAVEQQPSA
jgi:hypothetical protein